MEATGVCPGCKRDEMGHCAGRAVADASATVAAGRAVGCLSAVWGARCVRLLAETAAQHEILAGRIRPSNRPSRHYAGALAASTGEKSEWRGARAPSGSSGWLAGADART